MKLKKLMNESKKKTISDPIDEPATTYIGRNKQNTGKQHAITAYDEMWEGNEDEMKLKNLTPKFKKKKTVDEYSPAAVANPGDQVKLLDPRNFKPILGKVDKYIKDQDMYVIKVPGQRDMYASSREITMGKAASQKDKLMKERIMKWFDED